MPSPAPKPTKIAVYIDDEVQFFSIEPVIKALQKVQSYKVDIVVDAYRDRTDGFADMSKRTRALIRSYGYKTTLISKDKPKKYDLCLAAYTHPGLIAKCWIHYNYGTINAKPNLTYTYYGKSHFHVFLCNNLPTAEILSVYGKTYLVDNLRMKNPKKLPRPKTSKKIVLFAPTYNEFKDADEIAAALKALREKYYIVSKLHHATAYRTELADQKQVIEQLSDQCYSSEYRLTDLFTFADAVLVNNSGAIGDALYAGVPVAIYSRDVDQFNLGDLRSTQSHLIASGVLPQCSQPSDVLSALSKCLTPGIIKKQQAVAETYYPASAKTGVKGYLDVIHHVLTDESVQDYLILHDYYTGVQDQHEAEIATLAKLGREKDQLLAAKDQLIAEQAAIIRRYQSGKLYKIPNKLYSLKGKLSSR